MFIPRIVINEYFSLYINGVLHLKFKYKDLKGIQSYECGVYTIEYYLRGKTIVTEYSSKDKWLKILKQLDKL